jgi:hypothetical protein
MNKESINKEKSPFRRNHSPKTVFLVWAPMSLRAENISKRLEADLYLISYKFRKKIYSPIKYPILFVKTFAIIKRERPEIIICQTPPILSVLSVLICNFLLCIKGIVVIDSHTGAFYGPWSYLKVLNKSIMRRTSMTIVTNIELQDYVWDNYGIKSVVLEDPIPDLKGYE